MKKTISYLVMSVSVVGLLTLGSCSKSNSSLPAINGYNSSGDVAKENLLANWTFDNTLNEGLSGTAPTTMVGNSFVAGTIGQALSLSSGYVNYPTLTAFGTASTLSSFSVSLWFKDIKNNQATYTQLFGLTQDVADQTDWNAGPLNIGIETAWKPATNDTLPLHPFFNTLVNSASSHQDNVANGDFSDLGKTWNAVSNLNNPWIHYVCVYDQTTSIFVIYANNVLVSNTRYQTRFTTSTPMTIAPPIQAIVGGVPNASNGYANSTVQTWQGLMTGTVDDIRVYGKALSVLEVGSLYQLGSQGR